ncbi:MAG: crossover junction endodeoxyribonuclease RuvC [Candidatus Shapirobacteria bacterium]|jgi:crossover junction endodeoxyribonuclease RuvC
MILGIDPGLENTGWGVINYKLSITNYELIDCGVILTNNKDKSEERLEKIFEEIQKIIKKYKVKEVAMESLFFAKNVRSAMAVAEAIGVIKVAAKNLGKPIFEYTPLQIKMAFVGYGRAEKEQVETMVRSCLNLEEAISPSHASDAVAAALTHGFTMRI